MPGPLRIGKKIRNRRGIVATIAYMGPEGVGVKLGEHATGSDLVATHYVGHAYLGMEADGWSPTRCYDRIFTEERPGIPAHAPDVANMGSDYRRNPDFAPYDGRFQQEVRGRAVGLGKKPGFAGPDQ